jgi:hypothetical protein
MATQTTYPSTQPAAVAGAQATMKPAEFVSRTVEGAAIGFGVAVEQGTSDKGIIAFNGGTVFGVTALDRSASGQTVVNGLITATASDTYGVGETAKVQRALGDMWVVCTTGCAAGDPVYVRPSNNTFQNSSANSGVQIVGARWDTTAAAGALAVLNFG